MKKIDNNVDSRLVYFCCRFPILMNQIILFPVLDFTSSMLFMFSIPTYVIFDMLICDLKFLVKKYHTSYVLRNKILSVVGVIYMSNKFL